MKRTKPSSCVCDEYLTLLHNGIIAYATELNAILFYQRDIPLQHKQDLAAALHDLQSIPSPQKEPHTSADTSPSSKASVPLEKDSNHQPIAPDTTGSPPGHRARKNHPRMDPNKRRQPRHD